MSPRRSAGFTLLELIVVIGIFAVFAAMAYGGLDSVLKTRTKVEASLDRTEQFQRAYLRLRTDFENGANRPVRDTGGEVLPAFVFDNYLKRVEFTRGGWLNLLSQPRATLERVAYSLDDAPADGPLRSRVVDKRLVRRSWRVLDRAPQTEPVQTVVLEHVDDLSWRFLDSQNQWQDTWPANGSSAQGVITSGTAASLPPPVAVEIRMTTKDWGELRYLFRLGAEGMSAASNGTPAAGTTTGSTTGTTTGTTTGSTTGSTTGGTGTPQ